MKQAPSIKVMGSSAPQLRPRTAAGFGLPAIRLRRRDEVVGGSYRRVEGGIIKESGSKGEVRRGQERREA